MSRTRILKATVAALQMTATAAAADGIGADTIASADVAGWPGRVGHYAFEVTRDGKPIGTQSIDVKQDGDALTVVTESKIAVTLVGVVVYRMHQVITETYQGRRLVALHAETQDPDGLRVADVKRDAGDHWSGTLGKQPRAFDCDCMASTMWQAATIGTRTIIEASQARLRKITVRDRGTDTLNLPEGPVTVHHYAVKGEIERDVWFDGNGNLVSAQQTGRDGSLIIQNLLSDPSGSREPKPETKSEAAQP
ncbi:MAG TPA: DUF6134 family protein [Candidatus Binatia bacterium]|nr:DUF6134 family protein [Candidatus Binatia bacterium]